MPDLNDPILTVVRALSPEQRDLLVQNFCQYNPGWRGAHTADVLAALLDHDAHLAQTERMIQRFGTDVSPRLVSLCTLAAIYGHPWGSATEPEVGPAGRHTLARDVEILLRRCTAD